MYASENNVKLARHWGDDRAVAEAAWASTGGVTPEKQARVASLIKRLAEHGHHSCFEHVGFTFAVTSELATHIHVLKHRIGVSVNSASARYRELNDDRAYVPSDWPDDLRADLAADVAHALGRYHYYLSELERRGFPRQRAKESARLVRPYSAQIDYFVTMNFRSFVHFVELRGRDKTGPAQVEVKKIALRMVELVRDTGSFHHSLEAFGL